MEVSGKKEIATDVYSNMSDSKLVKSTFVIFKLTL